MKREFNFIKAYPAKFYQQLFCYYEHMKLITLNVWGGKKQALLQRFFEKYKSEVGIFCLQEVSHDPQKENLVFSDNDPKFLWRTNKTLAGYEYYFNPSIGDYYGLSTFVHKEITVSETGDVFVSGNYGDPFNVERGIDHPRNIQYIDITNKNGSFAVHNLHGFWTKEGKADTSQRIQQAKNIRNHLNKRDKPQIICGDFNMRPNIKSMEIIESAGMRNLIKEHSIERTRTEFYDGNEPHADYILISDGIAVNDFQVLPDEVSDHAPLMLDFTVQ